MAPDIEIRDAEIGDADLLAPVLRDADLREIQATMHGEPADLIRLSIQMSPRFRKTVFADGDIALIFGVGSGSLLSDTGSPWLLGSELIEQHPKTFLRHSKKFVPKMKRGFRFLENQVAADNRLSIAWLKWLGFTIEKEKPWGVKNLMFRRFTMEIE